MNNSTRCSTCNNQGSYSVAQYRTMPNGGKVQDGWKTYECKNCKLMLDGLRIIEIIKNRLTIIENNDIKVELQRLLDCLSITSVENDQ